MGLVLGILVAIGTVLWLVFTAFAASKSDSPSAGVVSFWPEAVIGFGLTGLLLASHFLHWGW